MAGIIAPFGRVVLAGTAMVGAPTADATPALVALRGPGLEPGLRLGAREIVERIIRAAARSLAVARNMLYRKRRTYDRIRD